MRKLAPSIVMLLTAPLLAQTTQPAAQNQPTSSEVVKKIVQAAGGDVWPSVKRIQFTFNVEDDGKIIVSRRHDWDLRAGVDVVSSGGKTITVPLQLPPDAAKEGFSWWTNDSYWLLMPLKLADAGANVEQIAGATGLPMYRLTFGKVGLTPGDQYDLTLDPAGERVTHWMYRPNDKTALGFTWEDYQDFNGLMLSTNHKSDDGKRRIFFTPLAVERD